MIVICANWAITDGTLGGGGVVDAGRWFHAVHRAAHRQGFGHDGRYRPVGTLDLVFAGDTFDWLTTTAWLGAARPWHGGSSAGRLRARVRKASLRRAGTLLRGLARWVRRGLAVPAADRSGRPRPDEHVPVPVRVVLLSGDRDAWLEETALDAARFGLAIGSRWGDESLDVWHGEELDPFRPRFPSPAGSGDRCPTLGESLAIDLVARFGAGLVEDGHCGRAVGRLLVALGTADPVDMPVLIDRWTSCPDVAAVPSRSAIVEKWRNAVEAWHRAARADRPTHALACCPIDSLADSLHALDSPCVAAERAAASGLASIFASASHASGQRAVAGPQPHRIAVLGHARSGGPSAEDGRIGPVLCLGPPTATGEALRAGRDGVVEGPGRIRTVIGRRDQDGRVEWEHLHDVSPAVGVPVHVVGGGVRLAGAA